MSIPEGGLRNVWPSQSQTTSSEEVMFHVASSEQSRESEEADLIRLVKPTIGRVWTKRGKDNYTQPGDGLYAIPEIIKYAFPAMTRDVVYEKARKIYNNFVENSYNNFKIKNPSEKMVLEYARYEIQMGTSRSLIYQGESIEEYMQSMRTFSIHRDQDPEFEKELIDAAEKTIDGDRSKSRYCDYILEEIKDYFKVFEDDKQDIYNAKKSEGENSEYVRNLIWGFERHVGIFDYFISNLERKIRIKAVSNKKASEIREKIDVLQDRAEEYRRDLATLLAKVREPDELEYCAQTLNELEGYFAVFFDRFLQDIDKGKTNEGKHSRSSVSVFSRFKDKLETFDAIILSQIRRLKETDIVDDKRRSEIEKKIEILQNRAKEYREKQAVLLAEIHKSYWL